MGWVSKHEDDRERYLNAAPGRRVITYRPPESTRRLDQVYFYVGTGYYVGAGVVTLEAVDNRYYSSLESAGDELVRKVEAEGATAHRSIIERFNEALRCTVSYGGERKSYNKWLGREVTHGQNCVSMTLPEGVHWRRYPSAADLPPA